MCSSDLQVKLVHQIQLRYGRPLLLEPKECQQTLDHAQKLMERPMTLGDGEGQGTTAAPTRRADARAASAGQVAPTPAPQTLVPKKAAVPMPDSELPSTAPMPLMAGATPAAAPGGLRARLQARSTQR